MSGDVLALPSALPSLLRLRRAGVALDQHSCGALLGLSSLAVFIGLSVSHCDWRRKKKAISPVFLTLRAPCPPNIESSDIS